MTANPNCPRCLGTGKAPGDVDGRECGICEFWVELYAGISADKLEDLIDERDALTAEVMNQSVKLARLEHQLDMVRNLVDRIARDGLSRDAVVVADSVMLLVGAEPGVPDVQMPEPDFELNNVDGSYVRTHPGTRCEGRYCVIHNPSDHRMRFWKRNWRGDRGLMERICPHGVGHPDPDDAEYRASKGDHDTTHGCDGCCRYE